MTDWSAVKADGCGVQITSEAMHSEYLQWRSEQCCEKCGVKFADRPQDDKPWITETLCWRCWP